MPEKNPKEITIRAWRVVDVGQGVMVFHDPQREHVRIFDGPDPRPEFWSAPITDPVEEELHGYVQGSLFPEENHG